MKKILVFLCIIMLSGCGEQIDTGNRGVKTSWGKITSTEPLTEGLYFYNPFGGSIVEYECKTQASVFEMSTYTKDMQTADLRVTVNFNVDPLNVIKLHQEIGRNYMDRVVNPAISNAVKDVVGQWNAAQLVSNRDKAAKDILILLNQNLAKSYINVTDVLLNNIDYSDTFENAIEAKVVATQKAEEAKNRTVQVEEESKQIVLTAQAEAEAMKIKSNALSQNQNLVAYEAVQKWDGVLPVNIYGSAPIPFLNIK